MALSENRALVVGISNYPSPIKRLPAVASDVGAIARVLQSRKGLFRRSGTTVLTESKATAAAILASAGQAFSAASSDTVFVYLAGHGQADGGEYYFISHDTDPKDVARTAVPLRSIKKMFDECKSKRVFLWLDCCHSGGIMRPRSGAPENGKAILKRTLEVVQGEGRIIIAACTAEQLAYEDPSIGHGVFTHALLRGLRGEAESHGEVTASSLYDFIDREIGSSRQCPMFFGQTTGRIVLMQQGTRKRAAGGGASVKRAGKKSTGQQVGSSGNWVMLGEQFFDAKRVSQRSDGSIEVAIATRDAIEDAAVRRLKPPNSYGRHQVPFAHRNDAAEVNIESLSSESTSKGHIWTLELKPLESQIGYFTDVTYSEGGRSVTPEDVAEMRTRFILLNERPTTVSSSRAIGRNLWENQVVEQRGEKIVPPIPATFSKLKGKGKWREWARLLAIYLLKATHTVEHVEKLTIGAAAKGAVKVSFRGVRHNRYSNVDPAVIEWEGMCQLEKVR
jgi:hypothetical protein